MRAVLLDQQTFSDQSSLAAIKEQVTQLTCYPSTNGKQLLERCQEAEIIITNKVIIDAEFISKHPQLSLICIAATGTNNVDTEAAKRHGIAVTNVSGYSTPSVTQYVFSQILTYFSQINQHNNNVRDGKWQSHHSFCYLGNGSIEISGKTIAIVGYGALGKSVAKIAHAFDMEVLIAERPNANIIRDGRVSFTSALEQADILSLHCPENESTIGLMNTASFKLMKPSAMLINTARGAIVDNLALLNALQNKQLAYAALDVLDQEPPSPDHPLIKNQLSNLSISPHIAWASFEAQQRLLDLIAINIADFKAGIMTNRIV